MEVYVKGRCILNGGDEKLCLISYNSSKGNDLSSAKIMILTHG